MSTLLTAGTGLSNIACSAEECLSWIIVLLNILAVFYLIFCAYFRVTNFVKIVGYVWACALVVGTVAVIAVHPCIFTILSGVFTALIIMAILSVVLDKGIFANPDDASLLRPSGAYVIHKTDDGKYAYVLYNSKKVAICRSYFKYDTMDDVKKASVKSRENGYMASVEDRTKEWIEFVNHPKFVLCEESGRYRFTMSLADKTIILISDWFETSEQGEKKMKEAICAVKSQKLYYSEDEILKGNLFAELPVKPSKTVVEEAAATMTDDDEETVIVTDDDGVTYQIRYDKSFTAKLMQAPEETKRYYTALKNEILSYSKTKSRISWAYDSVYAGRMSLAKFAIRGKTLCVYYALNADDYTDSKYKVEKTDSSKYEAVPCMYRIKNDRRLKYAKQLIAAVCEKAALQQGEVANVDYSLPYAKTSTLLKKGLAKEVKVKVRK